MISLILALLAVVIVALGLLGAVALTFKLMCVALLLLGVALLLMTPAVASRLP